jgi:hypothetical protein
MVKDAKELNVKVSKARLLSKAELIEYGESMPEIGGGVAWWLSDINDCNEVGYAEGNYTEVEDMFTGSDYPNTYLRVALDIEGGKAGEQFIFYGFIFTALSESLAISNNVLGPVKYYDSEIAEFIYDDITSTIDAVIGTIFPYNAFED